LINNDNKQSLTYPDQPSPLTEYEVTGLDTGTPYIIQIQTVKGNSLSTIVKTGLRTGEFNIEVGGQKPDYV
jgi:Fibronectin type III domain.